MLIFSTHLDGGMFYLFIFLVLVSMEHFYHCRMWFSVEYLPTLPHPKPLLTIVMEDFACPEVYVNGIIKKVLFCVWLLCVSIVFLKFNRVVFCMLVISFYFWIVFHSIDILQFIYWLSHRWALWFVSSLGFLWLWLFLYQGGHKHSFLFGLFWYWEAWDIQ